MQQAEIGQPSRRQTEPGPRQEFIRRRQSSSGQTGGNPEEAIHQHQRNPSAPALPASLGLAEIRHQPARISLGGASGLGDHETDLIAPEAIQKEMRHHQIELGGRRLPFECVNLFKLNPRAVGLAELAAGCLDHARAAFDAGHAHVWIGAQQHLQKPARPLPQQQRVAGSPGSSDKFRPASL